jgi:hypothetical protein
MPRIPEGELDRIEGEISLERLAEARGIALKRHGADLLGLCPSTTTTSRASSSHRRKTCGTASARVRRAAP